MKQALTAASALIVAGAPAFAAEVERRGDPSQILFEEGKNYVEFSVRSADPNVSGVGRAGTPGAAFGPTGDFQDRYLNYALGYKRAVNDRLSLAFVIDEPVGADVTYSAPNAFGGGAFFGNSFAELESIRYTGMARYEATDRISVYGGLSFVGLNGRIGINSPATGAINPAAGSPPGAGTVGTYALSVDKDYRLGYMLGVAYEIPDIALRVALTYESKTEHEFDDNTGAPFEVELPQSVTLHAQTGIAADTLLFGSVRWREWTQFEIAPDDFFRFAPGQPPANSPITFGTEDIFTYRLGLGRQFSENWSGAFVLGYEDQHDNQISNLSGTDGYISYTVALTHETESWDVTGALSYIDIGDAESSVSSFSGNDALAFGLKVGLRF
jgi:long-subunit fatty acid transport protein